MVSGENNQGQRKQSEQLLELVRALTCVCMPLPASTTKIMRSIICAPPMMVRMRELWPGQSTSVICIRSYLMKGNRGEVLWRGQGGTWRWKLGADVRLISEVIRHAHRERRESEVKGDATLFRLGMFVERGGRAHSTKRSSERRFARVDMTQNANIDVERARVSGYQLGRHSGKVRRSRGL